MIRLALVLSLLPFSAAALSLDLPAGAEQTFADSRQGAARLPVAVYAEGRVPVEEYPGRISRQAWKIADAISTWEIAVPIEAKLREAGYTVRLSCETRDCGGFDFRFAVEVVPEPEMHVDLGDFRYIAAQREVEGGVEAMSLLISRSPDAGWVQIVSVEPGEAPEDGATVGVDVAVAPDPDPDPAPAGGFDPGTLVGRLEEKGHVVLDDVDFASGTAELVEGRYDSLAELGGYLRDHPDRTVAIVGHTDAVGSLAVNVALSKRRAGAVRDRLVQRYGVASAQVSADGVGFLSPRASNLTEEGREANRRVEVVLTSTE